jgi:Cft2 family RNA processing exonuclease
MNLHIGGGYGEHGRNCFLVKKNVISVLFDCGIMNGEPPLYPNLSRYQISSIDYIFISHSHLDHTGALDRLYEYGFKGAVYLSSDTYEQLNQQLKPRNYIFIDKLTPPLEKYQIDPNIEITWGRSGHCLGSVWYFVKLYNETVLFSGDYTEHSVFYDCDKIRNLTAGIALIDCAYFDDVRSAAENRGRLVKYIQGIIGNTRPILFPVPGHGRGEELKIILKEKFSNIPICDYPKEGACFVFLKDPQLKSDYSKELVSVISEKGGQIILTGNCDGNSLSYKLLKNGKAVFYRYNVHQNLSDTKYLCSQNNFKKIILTHYAFEQ